MKSRKYGHITLPSFHIDAECLIDQKPDLKIRGNDFELADSASKESFIENKPSMSYWQDAWRRLKKNKVAMFALYCIIFLILFAFIGPFFSEYTYSQQTRGHENCPPFWQQPDAEYLATHENFSNWDHPFGTDNLGRDMMVRLMKGTQVSMIIGFTASLIVLVIGALYGSISGYVGGRVDDFMMRFVELLYSIPDILIVLLLASSMKPALTAFINKNPNSGFSDFVNVLGAPLIGIFIAFALLYWVGTSRIIRGQVMMLKGQEFVMAANALGASNSRIIMKHLLPNCIGQLIVTTCMQVPSAIFLESFLSFLGLGVSAPLTSLGSMAADAIGGIYSYTFRLIIPSVLLSVLILSFNLLGDGLRDALDPRLKR
jgi:oligopeptide transport system permease protein